MGSPSPSFADEQQLKAAIGHLRTQFETARPVLFTGAGFSLDAKNAKGRQLPTSNDLRQAIWNLCFGKDPFDERNSLQDLYQVARVHRSRQLTELLRDELTVDSDSLPDWYKLILSFPWHRCYTLNVDDLPQAIDRRFQLPRKIKVTSAMSQRSETSVDERAHLHVIQLNGGLDDLPDNVTFSTPQYAQRLVRDEPWYNQLISDLLARPVVFIGTNLDEPPLWQYVEKRQSRGRDQQELRPKSYLITSSLSKARESCLVEYNITHIEMPAPAFATDVLKGVGDEAAQAGLQFLYDSLAEKKTASSTLDEVAALATAPNIKTEFLTGAEPIWADIQSGRAIKRDVDAQIAKRGLEMVATRDSPKGLLLISGTAGAGKGTSLKRIALTLASKGIRVAWVDSFHNRSPLAIKRTMTGDKAPQVLVIDDADVYRTELTSLIREVLVTEEHPFVILAIRSARIDRNLNLTQLAELPVSEISMPGLTDKDIGGLLDSLQRENRLGVLVNVKRADQERIFRDKCGRQLLVAMIEATSGKPFKEKIKGEFAQLEGDMQRIYALVAVATAFRFGINKNDLLLAVGSPSNSVLNAIDRLVKRHVILCDDSSWYRARHRVIAEEVFADLALNGQVAEVLLDLTRAAAMQVSPADPANSRHHRIIRRMINHEFLKTAIGFDEARYFYASLESLLRAEHNYWLHRGSLEVEQGSLELGENFLNQARARSGSDMNVQTEYGYLLFRKALENPAASHAKEYVTEATALLKANIATRGAKDPHAYHVLGNNMLEWIERGIPTRLEKKTELEALSKLIEEGASKHPSNEHLKLLRENLRDAYLGLAVA